MNSTAARLTEGRIIAIVRGVASEDMLPLVRALEAGGVRAIEVTFDQRAPESWPDTLSAIRAIADEFNGRVLPGAGTVLTPERSSRPPSITRPGKSLRPSSSERFSEYTPQFTTSPG